MRKHLLIIALILGILGMAAAAYAQVGLNPGGAGAATSLKKVPFYGFGFDFTASDNTGLNSVGQNYRNDLTFYFEPTWRIGARWLSHTRWRGLTLAGRFAVTQNVSGVDETNFSGYANSG